MCGRFSISTPWELVKDRFGVDREEDPFMARYNAAPGQRLPIIFQQGNQRLISSFQWGLVPFWSKDKKIGSHLINARAETVATKPAFRSAFKDKRCLIPANGFFEWDKKVKPARAYYITLAEDKPFAMAGICDHWQNGKELLDSFAIITTASNSLVSTVHDRMPVILAQTDESAWLDPKRPLSQLSQLLRPFPADQMKISPVSSLVNNPKNDRREIIAPLK